MATILIVDDRPSNRQFLTTLLGYSGHQLLEAGDGAVALELVRTRRPDLVVTDILMPTMNGYEFVQQVRADPALAPTPVIFYTATYSTPQAEALARSCGVATVLSKPCEPQLILAAVSRELGVRDEAGVVESVPLAGDRVDPGRSSADDSLKLFRRDLQEVQDRFEDLVRRSSGPQAKRDGIKDLSQKFAENVAAMQRLTSRYSALLEVGVETMTERDPARLVELFFAAACDIIDSSYAAIGMLGHDEQSVHLIFAKGFDAKILLGDGARRGVLGKLLSGHRVLRMRSADGMPTADGLPAGHPATHDLLGIPVASAERTYGWMYFADRRGQDGFSEEDTRLAAVMTTKLALLYENAMLYDDIQRHAAQLMIEVGERRKTQKALQESEAGLYRAQILAKLAHVITGPEGLFESWSETLPRIAADASGRMPTSTREWLELVHPDDRERFRSTSIDAAVKRARSEVEYRLRHPAGTWLHVRQVMEPVDGSGGADGGVRWFNTLQDVTEQKGAEEGRRESDLRFRQMAENIRDVFFLQNLDSSQIYYVSPAYEQIWGRTCESLYANPASWGESVHPDDLKHAFTKFAEGRDEGFDYEFRIIRPDGDVRWIHVRGFPILDDAGKPYRTAGVAADITGRKQAEIRIRRLNRVYAVLSQINALIVRAKNRDELFREASQIAVEQGGFCMAWIGLVDHDAGVVKPLASAGDVRDFFDAAPMAVLENKAEGYGLAGRAVRTKKPMLSNDVRKDPQRLMRKEMDERGINSLAVIPLIVGGEGVGVLALYAAEAGFFDEEEMRLLLELAGDISFALDHIAKADKLEYLALYDPLTGLANRSLFLERLGQKILDAGATQRKVAVWMLDIERFKTINDAFGRQSGDKLLQEIAERTKAVATDVTRLARLGADQFAVMSDDAQNENDVARMTERRLQDIFSQPFRIAAQDLRVSARFGIALSPADGVDAESLLRSAEAALKKAKATGERYLFFAQEMTARIHEKLSLESRLREALEKDQFVLHYQPKVDAETRKVLGVEALIRWQSAEGLVPPGKFIPLMEETGMIREAGAWALQRAVLDHRHWLRMGIAAPRVAVNVSPIQLRQQDFVDTVKEAIAQGANPTGLDLEITESLIMEDVQSNIRKLKAIRDLGVSVAIDDFGTGYSSLAYLARLPVETLKIDRSFIIGMLSDPNTMLLIQTMITLAHSLRLKVVAEGVETEEQAKMLRLLRCDELQGYLISRPVPIEDITPLLRASPGKAS